ncbi:MAG: patatin-like phospholipase family protein [Pseudoramibacter sp.]
MEYGLLLNGNGAQADFQLGAWKALDEVHLHFDWIISASTGNLAAALIAQRDFRKISAFLADGMIEKITALNDTIAGLYLHYWSDLNFDDFRQQFLQTFSQKAAPLLKALPRYLDEDAIRRSAVRLDLILIDPESLAAVRRTLKDIPEGRLIPTLLLGAVFPVFRKQEDQDMTYFEAGFLSDLPLGAAAASPCKKLISIGYSQNDVRRAFKKQRRPLSYLAIENSEYLELSPSKDPAALRESHRRHSKLGYLDTLKALHQLVGEKLYIDPRGSHRFFDRMVKDIGQPPRDPVACQLLMALLDIAKPYTALKQFDVLEKVLNLLARSSWRRGRNKILSLLEMTAWSAQIPKLKIYGPDELIFEILDWSEQVLKTRLSAPAPDDAFSEPSFFDCVKWLAVRPESISLDKVAAFREQAAPEMILSLVTFYYIQWTALNFT